MPSSRQRDGDRGRERQGAQPVLGYLVEVGVDDLATLGVRDVRASFCANVDCDA